MSITRITFYYGPQRRKAEAGDVKIVRGKTYVRQQMRSQGGYCVRNGRPMYEWVPEDQTYLTYRSGWVQPPRKRKNPAQREEGETKL